MENKTENKIIVVGDEEFTLGFELVGIESRQIKDIEKLISKIENTGIIILSQESYENLSLKIKNKIDSLLKPIVVILSKDDIKGNNLREKVMRVLGVDLMK